MIPVAATALIEKIGPPIVECIFGKAGEAMLDRLSTRLAIKKIIRKDIKHIKEVFADKETSDNIESFFLNEIFQDKQFLFPGESLPSDKRHLLVQRYEVFQYQESLDSEYISYNGEFEDQLVDCVDFHNNLVHKTLLSSSDQILLRGVQNKIDALGYTGRTLNPDTDLLSDNQNLAYTHQQVDGILHALRMDLKFYRLAFVICIIGVLALIPAAVVLASRDISAPATLSAAVLCILTLSVLASACLRTLYKMRKCETMVTKYTDALWDVNFAVYREVLLKTGLLQQGSEANSESPSFQELVEERAKAMDAENHEMDEAVTQ